MREKGMVTAKGIEFNPGDPNDEMYLRQAEHLMKRGAYNPAIVYLHQSLKMNPESKVEKHLLSLNDTQNATSVLFKFCLFLEINCVPCLLL